MSSATSKISNRSDTSSGSGRSGNYGILEPDYHPVYYKKKSSSLSNLEKRRMHTVQSKIHDEQKALMPTPEQRKARAKEALEGAKSDVQKAMENLGLW